MRNGVGDFVRRRSPKATPRIAGYADFSVLDDISTAAAVMLAADYDRIAQMVGQVPPTVELLAWNKTVLTRLHQLGFFQILGHVPEIKERLIEDGPTLTMRIVRAENADELARMDASLQVLAEFLAGKNLQQFNEIDEAIVKVLTAISEAITNVTQHAYPDHHSYEFEHIGCFWVAATADRDKGILTVVVYDQGASIPVTYPILSRTEKVKRYLERTIKGGHEFDYENDGTYIRAAMRFGGSQTGKPYRGKGFPQMYELLRSIGKGRLTIRSRCGWCERSPSGKIRSGFLHFSLGGTLIEWTVELPILTGFERR